MKICINCGDYCTSHNDDCRRSTYRHTPIKIVGGSFLQNAPGGLELDAESDPCALTPPNCNMLHAVRNMFLYARCCPQLIKAPLSQSTWPIHSPSQSMWHQKSFVSSNTQGESGSCYIPDNQRIGKICMKSSQSLVDNNALSAS